MDTGIVQTINIALTVIGSVILVLAAAVLSVGVAFLYEWWKINRESNPTVRVPRPSAGMVATGSRSRVRTPTTRTSQRTGPRTKQRPRAVPTPAQQQGRVPNRPPQRKPAQTVNGKRLNSRPQQQTVSNRTVLGAFPIDPGWKKYITPVGYNELNNHQTCPVCSLNLKETYNDPQWKGAVRCTVNKCRRHGPPLHQLCAQSTKWGCTQRPAA